MTDNSNKQPLSATELYNLIDYYAAHSPPSLLKRLINVQKQIVAHWILNGEIAINMHLNTSILQKN